MGCTCQRNNSLKNEKPEKRSETQETNSQRNFILLLYVHINAKEI